MSGLFGGGDEGASPDGGAFEEAAQKRRSRLSGVQEQFKSNYNKYVSGVESNPKKFLGQPDVMNTLLWQGISEEDKKLWKKQAEPGPDAGMNRNGSGNSF